ncbi:NUDIX hydrolase [Aureibacter tunicatorum]|uniref:8-oxo-dGTP pyrophosphatase MutT (NUDIX family) n=1 Tax=Aureibacter tunicatorum TaxID=866807 RepID=A0AAE3XN05_9BACT|nr:CoA pyrophosphatase [Aureibacter tunicatorum]MDR6239583.1 8-oxo-dGTP pyrophosphatase MutT (NUDIX family) [Aureibacter tunicatorum]BDD04060.1 coenzyme A pyrophosphatase [Aureibacter tunicatorum]
MKNEALLKSLEKRVYLGDLPGKFAHQKMLPRVEEIERFSLDDLNGYRDSAVMILFYRLKSGWCIPLIKRNVYNGHHSNEISLPGGKVDMVDMTLENTAVRETYEEIGIRNDSYSLVGSITPVKVLVSKFIIHPFVAVAKSELNFDLDDKEVQKILLGNCDDMLSQMKKGGSRTIITRSGDFDVPVIDVEGESVWGATAMILAEALELFHDSYLNR